MEKSVSFSLVENIDCLDQIGHFIKLRHQVFRDELNIHLPDNDVVIQASNLGMFINGKLIGTTKLFVSEEFFKMQSVAISKDFRGSGFGKLMMLEVKRIAESKGFKEMKFRARVEAVPFYIKLGAVREGDEFLLVDRYLQQMEWKFAG